MRRAFGFAGAWLMTTVVAMGVTWLGCAIVLGGASQPAPPVTADLQAVDGATTEVPHPTIPQVFPAPQSAGRSRALPPPRTTTPPRASRSATPTPTVPRSTTLPDELPITLLHAKPPAEPSPPPAPQVTTPPGGSPDPSLEHITTPAGEAWIGFSDKGVMVYNLVPDQGYEWHIAQDNAGALLVVLTQPGHEFDLYAAWTGAPDASLTEYVW
jgi:hypothetical protein